MLSIPATKAFEIGSGFRGTEVPGSQHNDAFVADATGRLRTVTNWSGGVQGGITNGENIYFRHVTNNRIRIAYLYAATGLDLNRLQLFPSLKKRPSIMAHPGPCPPGGDMIPVSFPALYPLSRQWRPSWSWTSYSCKIPARLLQVFFLPSPHCLPPW